MDKQKSSYKKPNYIKNWKVINIKNNNCDCYNKKQKYNCNCNKDHSDCDSPRSKAWLALC